MTEKEKKTKGISRREFLRDAGLLVGGTAIGSTVLLAACGGEETTVTDTVTTTAGAATVTDTVTTTAGGATVTETQTQSIFICPIDSMEFDTLAELQAHFEAAHPEELAVSQLSVNGGTYMLNLEPDWSLAFVLRDKLRLFGTKIGCNRGECSTCTVIADGQAILSCLMLAVEAQGKAIWTVEGLSDGVTYSPIQQAFFDNDAFQCGYCTPGFLMAGKALLDEKPNPTMDEVREALSGHICVCGIFWKVLDALEGGV